MIPAVKIVVSGSRGLIGSALVRELEAGGHIIRRLVRGVPGAPTGKWAEARWDPPRMSIEGAALEGCEAVVHLAGENVASGRWTAARKALIRDSRVKGTALLAETLARLQQPPRVLVCASAIGFYGDRGDEILTEDSPPGKGFLATVCREWEAASAPAEHRGIRVVRMRIGVVLAREGGALAKMLTPFRLGLGGRIGSGLQYMSWISIGDVVGALQHALTAEALRGAVNAVSPKPVTNAEFTRVLARVLGRPALLPLPAFAARFAFGQMADELLLASARVMPERLPAAGYRFRHPEIEGALRQILGR
jgi:hypothetical protein